ncbi:MAG: efflux RND transporter permease subunit, partial [Planctomycetes bacterium]|nr:efflux RND transporter permease subunit [Planctomycetota bacterium]
MNLPEFSVKRGITTLMIFFAVVLLGTFCLVQTPIDLFPEMDIPSITVMTPYEGAGPRDIEEKVTQPLEEVLSTVEDVEHVFSTSSKGVSTIRLNFGWGTDLEGRANDIRDAIDFVQRRLPEEADNSRIYKFDISQFPIMVFGIRATESYEDLEDILDEGVANRLESIPGVAAVTVIVPLQRQVNVDLNRERLASYNLTPDDVVRAIAMENQEMSAGSIETGYTDYLPRVPGEFESVEPMNDIVLTAVDGNRIVRLEDVGEVSDGFEEVQRHITINGGRGAIMFVSKQSDANTVTVARAVRDLMPKLTSKLPADIEISNVMDSSEDIERVVSDLLRTLLIGGALAMLVVLVFLRQLRGTFVIGLAIPFSLILAGALMYMLDYTINMITLFAFIVAIGMVVDNAIVILENITRHREQGESPREGAVYGASEVAMAITASTLTTLCILFPLLFVRGIVRVLFTPFAAVAGMILLASLFSALTLTPMLASRLLPEKFVASERKSRLFQLSEAVFNRLRDGYSALLGRALRHRAIVIFAAVLLMGVSLGLVPRIGWEFTPSEDRSLIRGTIKLPVGTRVEKTAEVMQEINRIIEEEIPPNDLRATFTECGSGEGRGPGASDSGDYVGSFGVKVSSKDERDWTVFEKGQELRERIKQIQGIYAIEKFSITLQDPMSGMMAGGEKPLSVNIRGDDMEATDRLAAEIKKKVKNIPGAVDISISREKGAPELWVNVDRAKASSMGLNVSDVANTVRASIYGRVASKYRVAGDEYDIFVRLRKEDRSRPDDLEKLSLRLPSGELVRVENIADVTSERGPVEIERKDQVRVVRVEGDVHGRSLGKVIAETRKIISKLKIPTGVEVRMGGQSEDISESFFWLTLALGIGVVLVYMVMASQFESLLHPFVVMFALPFAFVGVVWGLFVFGHSLNVIVFLGMLLLIGVVVNNAIVLVDYINILRARGLSMTEAIRRSGERRLRPVLMTAFTTVLALVPMAFGKGQGSEVWNPLGVTILGGLLVATLVTLVIVPVMYSILERGH